jgi:hypothetical protein
MIGADSGAMLSSFAITSGDDSTLTADAALLQSPNPNLLGCHDRMLCP